MPELDDQPPSAKLVSIVLANEDEPLTQQELVEKTRLCGRTVRYALNRLEENGVLTSQVSLQDARQKQYTLDP